MQLFFARGIYKVFFSVIESIDIDSIESIAYLTTATGVALTSLTLKIW